MVVMGRVIAPFGVKGWVKIQPFSATPENLLRCPLWWLRRQGDADWRECRVDSAKVQGDAVVAKLAGCDDRDVAAEYRGLEIAVPRESLPPAEKNEFYWADLIGLEVVNELNERLGRVSQVFETGANDVLVVDGADDDERERLIPFIESVVKEVNVAGGVIRVDWAKDY